MKLNELRNTKLDKNILGLHPNNHGYRKYKRSLIDEDLLYECIVINEWTSLHTSVVLTDIGVKCDASYIIERCKEYKSIPKLTSSDSAKRAMEKRNETNLERYGATNVLSKGTKAYHKRNETVEERYGCSSVFGNDEIKDKIKATNLQKYGREHPYHIANIDRNFTKPHKIVSWYLNKIGIKHENEKRNQFQGYNKTLGKTYSPIPDVYIDATKVIEIYGDHFHCNPLYFKEDDMLSENYYIGKTTVKKLWEKDKNRIQHIESFGCDVLIIWETDINNGKYKEMIDEWLSDSNSK